MRRIVNLVMAFLIMFKDLLIPACVLRPFVCKNGFLATQTVFSPTLVVGEMHGVQQLQQATLQSSKVTKVYL